MTAQSNRKVSIVITCYNYEKYVAEAIESALSQTHRNIELIIINDGSTDASLEAIKRFEQDSRVKVINRENRGVVYTRNEALEASSGEYVIQLDADDYLDNNYVEKTLSYAVKNQLDLVYTNFEKFGAESEISDFPEYSLEELKNHNFVHISSLLRKGALGDVRFDEKLSGRTHEDWDFFLSLGVSGAKMGLCDKTFLHYRIHTDGRNNMIKSYEERLSYTSVYSYITKKHAQTGAQGFDYLVGTIFADWYQEAGAKFKEAELQVAVLKDELSSIRSSKVYKLSLRLARLKRFFKP